MKNTNRAKGLTKNFRPQVPLKNGKPCSLKRHYRGALRQVAGYLDLLANKDPERFVWASITDIREHCKDYSRDRLYGRRVISDCKQALVEQGVISRNRVVRMRNGEWREGFIVRSHGEVTTISTGQECIFSDGFPDQSAQASAYVSAYPSAQASAYPSAQVNGEKCIGECIPECIGQAEQQPNESSEYKESQKVFPEFSKSFSAPSLLSYKPNSPLALESHTKSDGPEPSEADGFGNDLFFGNGPTEIQKDQNAADAFSGDPQRTAPKEEEEKEVDIPW